MKKSTEQFAAELLAKHSLVLTSEYVSAHSKIHFKCKNGHSNEGVATNILQRGYKCKQCTHGTIIVPKILWDDAAISKLNSLATLPLSEIAKAFNTTESAITSACTKFNISRTKLANTYANLQDSLASNNRVLATDYQNYKGVHTKIQSTCSKGHTTEQLAGNILYNNTGCPLCYKEFSAKELELYEYIKSSYDGWIIQSDRTILEGKELDIVIPDLGLAFEFNGNYWHSDEHIDKHYHINKTNTTEAFGFRLIHIPEYLWDTKQDLVKAKIMSALNKTPAIAARKCTVKRISFPKEFLEQNHLQGSGAPTSINYGLFYNNELMSVMTFGKPRFTSVYEYELIRFCTKHITRINGGASKLLKAFEREYQPKNIISYANRMWSSGVVYNTLGFLHTHNTEPGYVYTKKNSIVTRYAAQKSKLSSFLKYYDADLSEYENMLLNNYSRVWDCGNQAWVKRYYRHHHQAA